MSLSWEHVWLRCICAVLHGPKMEEWRCIKVTPASDLSHLIMVDADPRNARRN